MERRGAGRWRTGPSTGSHADATSVGALVLSIRSPASSELDGWTKSRLPFSATPSTSAPRRPSAAAPETQRVRWPLLFFFPSVDSPPSNHLLNIWLRSCCDIADDAKKRIQSAQVVCCTCTGAGSSVFDKMKGGGFKCVLIDEAAQATEPITLIPLVRGCCQLVLVGDHHQLPPTVISKQAEELGLSESLFGRLACAPMHFPQPLNPDGVTLFKSIVLIHSARSEWSRPVASGRPVPNAPSHRAAAVCLLLRRPAGDRATPQRLHPAAPSGLHVAATRLPSRVCFVSPVHKRRLLCGCHLREHCFPVLKTTLRMQHRRRADGTGAQGGGDVVLQRRRGRDGHQDRGGGSAGDDDR